DDQDVVFVFHDTSCLSGCISGLPGPGGSFYICFFHLAACMPLGFGLRLSTSRPACRPDSACASPPRGLHAARIRLAPLHLAACMPPGFGLRLSTSRPACRSDSACASPPRGLHAARIRLAPLHLAACMPLGF